MCSIWVFVCFVVASYSRSSLLLTVANVVSPCYHGPGSHVRLPSHSLRFTPVTGRAPASLHSYRPRTIRSIVFAPTSIPRLTPRLRVCVLRATYCTFAVFRVRARFAVSLYPRAGGDTARLGRRGVLTSASLTPASRAGGVGCAVPTSIAASLVVPPPGTTSTSRVTSSRSASTSRLQYRANCSYLPSCHSAGASHPLPLFPPHAFSLSSVGAY